MNPLQIIEQLDELRFPLPSDPSTLKFFKAYPAIRKAVLAGEKLAEAVRIAGCSIGQGKESCMNCEALSAYHAEVNDLEK